MFDRYKYKNGWLMQVTLDCASELAGHQGIISSRFIEEDKEDINDTDIFYILRFNGNTTGLYSEGQLNLIQEMDITKSQMFYHSCQCGGGELEDGGNFYSFLDIGRNNSIECIHCKEYIFQNEVEIQAAIDAYINT